MPTLFQRLRAAGNLVLRGSIPNDWFARGMSSPASQSEMLTPYAQSAWVMRAIRTVAGQIASVPLEFSTHAADGQESDLQDPDLEMFWKTPALDLSRTEWIDATTGWLKLAGESFWVLGDTALLPFPEVRQTRERFVVARPDRMTHLTERGRIIGWRFTDGGGTTHALLPEQVIHLKNWNPYDPFRGLSEYGAARIAAETDFAAGQFARNMMKNNGDAGAIIGIKNGLQLDDKQIAQITMQLREKRQRQLAGEFRPIFLPADITVEDPKIQAPDATFTASRLQSRHEIAIAFGLPPSMFDVVASYSVGSASDRFRLVEDTCKPLGGMIADGAAMVVRRLFGREVEAEFCWEDHSTMQQVRAERMASIAPLWDRGVPMKQISEYLDLGLEEFPGWDISYLPFSVSPAGQAGDPAADASYAETAETPPPATEPLGAALRDFKNLLQDGRSAQSDAPRQAPCGCGCGETAIDVNRADPKRDPKEVALWRAHMARRRETMKAYEAKFRKVLFAARSEVLRKIEQRASTTRGAVPAEKIRAVASELMFDLVNFKLNLNTLFRSVSLDALQRAGEQVFSEVGKDDPWKMPPEKALNFLAQRENRLSGIGDDVFQRVQQTLQEGITGGETTEQLAERVRSTCNDIEKGRAVVIAQTETAAAYGTARQAALEESGITHKQWLTSGNTNVRPAHADANGQIRAVDEAFSVGGEPLQYPGDPEGSAWNVINCHCVSIAVEAPQ